MSSSIDEKNKIDKLLFDLNKAILSKKREVKKRLKEFKKNKNLFSELCFCILTANYSASGGIKIQKSISNFSALSEDKLAKKLKRLGHRFPNTRANYIFCAGLKKDEIEKIDNISGSENKREWLVKNILGLGYKEASHFLRNIGYFDVAIIDKHILSILSGYKIINAPKILTRARYIEIENILKKIAESKNMSLGELDLYLWYMKTGKILK
jgi:N-glycosylase/DNA lyase